MKRTIGRFLVLFSFILGIGQPSMVFASNPAANKQITTFGGEWPFPDAFPIPEDLLLNKSYEVLNSFGQSAFFRIIKMPTFSLAPYKFVIINQCMDVLGEGFAKFNGNVLAGVIVDTATKVKIHMEVAANRVVDRQNAFVRYDLYLKLNQLKLPNYSLEERAPVYKIQMISSEQLESKCKE